MFGDLPHLPLFNLDVDSKPTKSFHFLVLIDQVVSQSSVFVGVWGSDGGWKKHKYTVYDESELRRKPINTLLYTSQRKTLRKLLI